MKKYLFFLLLPLAIQANAQYSINTALANLRGTNGVVASGGVSNYPAALLSIQNTRYVTLFNSFATTNATASGTATFLWQTSIDATNWNDLTNVSVAASGTDLVSALALCDVGMSQWLRCYLITNNVNYAITNLYARVVYKVNIAQNPYEAMGFYPQPASATLTNWSTLATNSLLPYFNGGTWAPLLDVVYTNSSRAWCIGSAVLIPSVTGDATITINFTNNSISCLPIIISSGLGVSMTDYVPFAFPLATNATVQFVSSFGSGASGYLTNVMLWQE